VIDKSRRCENPKCKAVLPPPGVFRGKLTKPRFCGPECRSAMSYVRMVERFAAKRAKAERCPSCRGALGSDGNVLYCLDRARCDWSEVVRPSDMRKESAARRAPEPAPAPAQAPAPRRAAKPRGPQPPKPGTTTARALALLVTRPEGMEAHEIERALGLTFPVTLMALRRLLALSLAKRDPATRRYTAARGVVNPSMKHLQTPELRGLVAALATLSPVMVKRLVTAAAEGRAASCGKRP
jgi:hypothetical protein